QGSASDQNFGYRTEGSPSKVTVTNSSQEVTVTRASLREYTTVQRERYLRAPRAEKRQLLDEVVAVSGLHRKAAIRLLHRPPRLAQARDTRPDLRRLERRPARLPGTGPGRPLWPDHARLLSLHPLRR